MNEEKTAEYWKAEFERRGRCMGDQQVAVNYHFARAEKAEAENKRLRTT